jgi:hypothetical protein
MLAPNVFVRNRYLVVRLVAGTSALYEAIDLNSRTNVALKQVLGVDAASPQREAFEREARLLIGLRHPALPIVRDSFIEGQSGFLVAEFVPGDDLATQLARNGRPFPALQVLRWADQLLDTLDYMHTRLPPVLHRDVKPQNLKLTPRGQIMLLDSGLAKSATTISEAKPASSVGSPFQFVAPEQIQGAGADERSDLFSLAATLYYLLTGTLPVLAGKRANSLARGQPDPLPAAHTVNPEVSLALSDLLMQAMALDPAARPASASTMRAALNWARVAPAVAVPRMAPPTVPLVLPDLPLANAAELAPALPTPAAQASPGEAPIAPIVEGVRGEQAATPPEPEKPARRWLAAMLGAVVVLTFGLAFLLWSNRSAVSDEAPTLAPEQTTAPLAAAVVELRTAPSAQATVAPPPPPTPTVVTPIQSKTAAPAQPTEQPAALAQASSIEPSTMFAGALPILLTVRGAYLDRVRAVQLVSGSGASIPVEVHSRAGDQLSVSVAALPEPIKGEVNYALELDGVVQKIPAITLRDYRDRKVVQGVLADYSFTNRVATDGADTYTGLRSEPNANSQPLGRLRNGDQIDILRDDVADWYQVRIGTSGDPAQVGVVGWIERWLVDNQGAPAAPRAPTAIPTTAPLVFVGRLYSTPTDAAAQCGASFQSSIYGSVENSSGKGIAGAILRVVSADGRNRYSIRTARGGVYNLGGLGCTTWIIRLISVPGSAIQANAVTVKNLNGGRFTSAEVRYKFQR